MRCSSVTVGEEVPPPTCMPEEVEVAGICLTPGEIAVATLGGSALLAGLIIITRR